MKRVLLCAIMLLPVLSMADERSSQIIAQLAKQINALKSYQVEFSASSAQLGNGAIRGKYIVSGNNYYMSAEGKEIYSDGKYKYEVNPENKEVTIDVVNTTSTDILSNPTNAFSFVDKGYRHNFAGECTVNGHKCASVRVIPVDKNSPIHEILLYLDTTSGLPVKVVYSIAGVDSPVEITVGSIKKLASVDKNLFTFSKNRHNGYEIIDFR